MNERQEIQELYDRLAEINQRISQAKCWGALLTALSEERRGIERALKSRGE
jgi:hypothetical protein